VVKVRELQRAVLLRFARKHGIGERPIDHAQAAAAAHAMQTVAMRHGSSVALFEFGHNGDETGDKVILGLIVPVQDSWTIRQELARGCSAAVTVRLEPLGKVIKTNDRLTTVVAALGPKQ
jgi:hypothetical protein